MPTHRITAPDGSIYNVTAPDGATDAEVLAHVRAQHPTPAAATRPAPMRAAAPAPETGVWPSIRAALRGAADTVSFGTGDELGAAAQSLLPMGGSHSAYKEGFGKAYDANVAAIRGNAASDEANHSGARLAGQIGGAFVAPGAEAVGSLGRLALKAGLSARAAPIAARLAVNAGQGALYGAGSATGDVGNRAEGALTGGALGAAGGELGNAAIKGVSRVLAPVVNPAVQRLLDMGVNLSPGQRAGGGWNQAEGALARIPLMGSLAAGARNKSLTSANVAVANDALQHIGATVPEGVTGTNVHAFGQKAFGDAYDAVNPGLRFEPDATHNQEVADLLNKATTPGMDSLTPAYADKLAGAATADIGRRVDPTTGAMSGQSYADYVSKLKAASTAAKGSASGDERAYGGHLSELLDSVEANARKYSNPASIADKDKVDTGYALWSRFEDAAKRRGGEDGQFTPIQYDAAVQKGDGRVRSKGFLAGDALGQDNAQAIKAVLPDKLVGSDTMPKLALSGMMGLGGAGAAHAFGPGTLLPAAAAQLPYLPGVQQGLNYLTSGSRPAWATKAAGLLSQYAAPSLSSAGGILSATGATGN